MESSSFDSSPSSTDEYYMNTPIQDDVSSADPSDPSVEETSGSAEAQIGGRESIGNGTLEGGGRTRGGLQSPGGGVQTRGEGGGRTGGGLVMRGVRAARRRRYDLTRSPFVFTSIEDGDLFDNSFIEGRRAQVRGRGRGRGRPRGSGRGRPRGSGRGRGRGRRHEEDEEAAAATMVVRSADTEGTISGNIATLENTNMLDCCICLEALNIPVYQCVKGHISCSICRNNHKNKCPTCCLPIDYIRNYGLEEVLEAVKITCPNSKYGCKEKVTYSMKREHMGSCAYEACYCPLPGCGFDGSNKDLYLHFSSKHPASATRFTFDSSFSVHVSGNTEYKFLQENNHTLFILNYSVQEIGGVANIICMGPSCLQNEYSYELEARNRDTSSNFITLLVPRLPKWKEDLPERAGLVVQNVFFGPSWDRKIQVCIRRKGEN
ncbi:E3 ubiquitin-protein ligase SINA-like 2 [Apium graveolens]|uniref:E3 ubiquitin-protein ligase SINA-like 2 n=1 Tax=Apium graveolens TaxID=4045 RepID=UPI003D7A9036